MRSVPIPVISAGAKVRSQVFDFGTALFHMVEIMILSNRRVASVVLVILAIFDLGYSEDSVRTRFQEADTEHVTAFRDSQAIYLEIHDEELKSVSVPRLAAPLASVEWVGAADSDGTIDVQPEPEYWTISWDSRPSAAKMLAVRFADKPLLLAELLPLQSTSDGSFILPAHFAVTSGEKIRYEPQTFKNTVGYWVGKQDRASWTIDVKSPGRFNVAVLQGCGAGQGGSKARISFQPIADGVHVKAAVATEASATDAVNLDFEVLETGHFQNFQWRHLGEVEIAEADCLSVTVSPTAIKKNALMDIRAIHLIRLPK